MRIAVILNGTESKRSRWFRNFHQPLSTHHEISLFETTSAGDGILQTLKAIDQKPDALLAAGGDGTFNQMINGLMQAGSKIPVAVAPLGTGNDFAAICGIRNVSDLLIKFSAEPRPTDIGCVTGADQSGQIIKRFFINVSSIGLGPDVAHLIQHSSRILGADLTYLLNSVRAFLGQMPFEITTTSEKGAWKGKIRALAVANGIRFGSGLYIAPGAKIDDGLFSTFIAGDVPLPEFLFFLMKIKRGHQINHPKAHYGSVKTIKLEGPSGTWLETDGELACLLPAELNVLPLAVRIFR